MRSLTKFLPLFLFGAVGLAAAGRCAPAPDDEARFLAGLPVAGTPLESLSHSRGWAAYAGEFDRAWAQLDKHQLQTIAAWAPGAVGQYCADTGPVFYPFSGPDFLYAHAFFPNATAYVLCGIEPIGPLPQVENLRPETLDASLAGLRQSLDTLLDFSFFITKKMRTDLEDNRLSGTLPLLYIFLARSGCHIRDVSFIGLDGTGEITTGKTLAPAVKIVFADAGGKEQTLYYFCSDLSDDVVNRSGLLTWFTGLGAGRGLLKAASYLMHGGAFDKLRQFLLSNCDAILEDDSGIPIRYFSLQDWTLHLYGAYHLPIERFKKYPQPEMERLTAEQKPAGLPFSVGYRWHPGESSLIWAVKGAGRAGQ